MHEQEKSGRLLPIDMLIQEEQTAGLIPPYVNTYFYLNMLKPFNPHARIIFSLFDVFLHLDEIFLQKTMMYLLRHHDILRSRFLQEDGLWRHVIPDVEEAKDDVAIFDLSSIVGKENQVVAMKAIVQSMQFTLNLTTGPVFRIAYMDLGPEKNGWLLFVLHHIVVDGFSLRILTEDFVKTYVQVAQNASVFLPRKTNSFKQWSTRLNEYAQAPARSQEVDYLLHLPWEKVKPLPLDYAFQADKNIFASTAHVITSFSGDDTDRLLKCVRKARTSMMDVLITALVQAQAKWTESSFVHLGVMNHARFLFPDLNISRTVGFFTLIQDFLLEECQGCTFLESLAAIKKQIATVPLDGFSRDILSFSGKDNNGSERLQALLQRQIVFNYLGNIYQQIPQGSPLHIAEEEIPQFEDSQNVRSRILYIRSKIVQKQLSFYIEYSQCFHKQTTIEMYARYLIEALQQFVMEVSSMEQGGSPK